MDVRLRIAVTVDANGKWHVAGGHDMSDEQAMSFACDWADPGAAKYWIEATVQAPQVAVVQGTVSPPRPEAQ